MVSERKKILIRTDLSTTLRPLWEDHRKPEAPQVFRIGLLPSSAIDGVA
jgi:hypothetical protein